MTHEPTNLTAADILSTTQALAEALYMLREIKKGNQFDSLDYLTRLSVIDGAAARARAIKPELFCECESDCSHTGGCTSTQNLTAYRVTGYRQTLCRTCAAAARVYCAQSGEELETLSPTDSSADRDARIAEGNRKAQQYRAERAADSRTIAAQKWASR